MNLKKRFRKTNQDFRIVYSDTNVKETMGTELISWLPERPREYVVVCIGTDRSTGDALGPLTGSFFSEMKPKHTTVYGTLHHPVHATNLHDYIKLIEEKHRNPFIIAIDACLGKQTSIGQLIMASGPLRPGAALNKPLPSIGDVHITGVVNIGGFMEHSILQNTRLSLVTDMAKQIAHVLDKIDQELTYNYSFPAVILKQKKTI